jgi:hypothetical protein
VANPEEKNADHLVSLPSAYLLSTTHSKDVRFPWVTLYKQVAFRNKEKAMPSEDKMKFTRFCATSTNSRDVPEKFCGLKETHAYKHIIQIRNKIRSYEYILTCSLLRSGYRAYKYCSILF